MPLTPKELLENVLGALRIEGEKPIGSSHADGIGKEFVTCVANL